jgi:hypothetical protein
MPIKIFAAPGDHRDDFKQVETQANEWIAATTPRIVNTNIAVREMPGKRESGKFMLTLVLHYE